MPLYEYECVSCKQRLEVLQGFNDAPLDECPECNGEVRRLLSAPAFQFKGSGWYVTDYARGGNGESGKNGKNGKEASSSQATDSKDGSGDKPAAASADQTKDTASSSATKSAEA